jgi:hypothetical protein
MAFKWLDYYDLDDLFSEEEKMTRNVVRESVRLWRMFGRNGC